jgi:hypothetical protein
MANAGVWIDHRKAVIVMLSDQGESTRLMVSHVERQRRRTGDSPLRGRGEPNAEPMSDARERAYRQHLERYYAAVGAALREAAKLLILGPGEAKLELRKRLRKEGFRGRIVGVETADKMTDARVAAAVRQRFAA